MKTRLLFLSFWLLFIAAGFKNLNAQVTIGSDKAPKDYSTLQIDGKDGGLRLPQLNTTERTALQSKLGTDAESVGLLIYNTSVKEVQFWDGTQWVAAKGGSTITVPSEPWLISGGTTEATANTDHIYQMGHVSIGNSTAIDGSAILRVDASNKGVLFPRVTLTSTTDQTTVSSPAVGLMVYNTGNNAGFNTAGYVYWTGARWELAKSTEHPWKVSGDTKAATSNTENIYQLGHVTIGHGEAADASAILNVEATNKGVLMPRVTLTSVTDKTTIANPTEGLMVYNTGKNAGFNTAGYVYWTGAKWELAKSTEPWMVSGSTTEVATTNTQNIYQTGQVTIGSGAAADPTAILNVTATDKGVLLPKVKLTASDDKTTIKDPTTGLLVYNEGTSTFPIQGYMYWNGTQWRLVSTSTSAAPKATLVCGQARLDPEQVLQAGVEISQGTVLRVPYTVGNGGMYNAAIIKTTDPTSNVQATISDGLFENGSGYLAFSVSGTPTSNQATPTGITFDLQPFYDANPTIDPLGVGCKTATVGTEIKADIVSVATMDNLKLTEDSGVKGYATQLTTPDGKFSVRAFILSRDFTSSAQTFGTDSEWGMNLQIRNNTSEDVVIAGQFNWHWGGSGGNGANYLGLQPGLWSGDRQQNVDNASQTYWANYVSDVRGSGWSAEAAAPTTSSKNRRGHAVYWGNNGIYAQGRPERRVYSWTINDGGNTKTAYILTFSSSALRPNEYARESTCPNGICPQTKVFMMIDQITAP